MIIKNRTTILLVFALMLTVFTLTLTASPSIPSAPNGTIRFDISDTPTAVNPDILGTNAPTWLNASRFGDSTFQARTIASGVTLLRFPGGSWSNAYDWLACERDGNGIDGNAECYWTWAGKPTDFIDFAQATGDGIMYTINQGGTSKEAAALVAFFNGSVSDNRTIGTDVRGRNWGKVSDWAKLRRDHGNADPFYVKYWEIGNETYGGINGTDCTAWGWENDVWTCDGTEYVNGIGSGSDRKEGYIEFRNAMRAIDSSIMVGAVGIYDEDTSVWSNWDNEVIAAAGSVMDFYIVHQYAFWSAPSGFQDALGNPQEVWKPMMNAINASFDSYAGGRRVPIAVTEHNLFSFQDNDNNQWMTRAVNMLFMADSIGQMIESGYSIANQWDLANGQAYNGTDYGLMDADSYARSPQYYVFPLWDAFGSQMLPVSSSYNASTTLSVYAGKVDDTTTAVFAVNKTGNDITTNIQIDGVSDIYGGVKNIAQSSALWSQSVTFNGVSNPSNDLSNAPASQFSVQSNPFAHTFEPYSVTLLCFRVTPTTTTVRDVSVIETADADWFLYLPIVSKDLRGICEVGKG